jgi:hypothetical protein
VFKASGNLEGGDVMENSSTDFPERNHLRWALCP